jgi:hypothetical protein
MIAVGAMLMAVAAAAAQESRPRQGDLKVGDAAPDFTIKDVQGKEEVRLSKLRDRPLVLIFGSCT